MIFITDYRIKNGSRRILEKYGTVILSDRAPVEWQMDGHPDLQVHLFEDILIIYRNASDRLISEIERNTKRMIISSEKSLKAVYPNDSILNAVTTDSFFIHDLKITDPVLTESVRSSKTERKIINVRQGYTRCTTLPVTSDVFLTSDRKISEEINKNGGSSLFTDTDEIRLKGYDKGFIGGTSCVVRDSERYLFFTFGDISKLKCFPEIRDFLLKCEIEPEFISLSEDYPEDLGSIIAI